MVLNGTVLSVVIIAMYVLALVHYCDGEIFQDDIHSLTGYENRLMNAQTVAFISLVFSENVRSYTSRSFDKPIWRNLCGNPQMQWAILLAQVAMFSAVLIPFFQMQQHQKRIAKASGAAEPSRNELEGKPSATMPAAEGLGAVVRGDSFKGPAIRSNSYSKFGVEANDATEVSI